MLCLLLIEVAAQAQTITKVFTSPSTVFAGQESQLYVDISEKATSNLTVSLSSDTSSAPVPATLTILAGNDYGSVTIHTKEGLSCKLVGLLADNPPGAVRTGCGVAGTVYHRASDEGRARLRC